MTAVATDLPPAAGDLVHVRSREYLVEEVTPATRTGDSTFVRLSCLDVDAQGDEVELLWEQELDARIRRRASDGLASHTGWGPEGPRDFDAAKRFAAYLHAVRWDCVTATDPKLLQAPWRAGIEVLDYQLEPLRKALELPRVNLFIADDVGLGKTIEAGLVVRELLLRQRVRRIVAIVPPSVLVQWKEELERRFGLTFQIYDRDFVAESRRAEGFGVNPWTRHNRFLLSHALLRDDAYGKPLRAWLDKFSPGSLLIVDEAHHAAPASGARYAVDSYFTRALRDVARRFEHRLFLSATPHNGLSNSFSALLEILDAQRFLRGTEVRPEHRERVMVRRLKSDLRSLDRSFPERIVEAIPIDGLKPEAPELKLAELLERYRELREARLAGLPPKAKVAQFFVTTTLQKRLHSSVAAFLRTLRAHRRGLERRAAATARSVAIPDAPGPDDERATLPDEELEAEAAEAAEEASALPATPHGPPPVTAEERALLDEMERIAATAANQPDARVEWLLRFVRSELCPGLPAPGEPLPKVKPKWKDRRILIFTEYADTKRYLRDLFAAVAAGTEDGARRVATFSGEEQGEALREEIKRSFNADPAVDPLRILIATDAAREGVNLQNHCSELFHFDLPWNPSRMEQRNGRIDRKLQRAPKVYCRYFVYEQRPADRVLRALQKRTAVIHEQLGSLPPVIEERAARKLERGIRAAEAETLARELEALDAGDAARVLTGELPSDTGAGLAVQLTRLRELRKRAEAELGVDVNELQAALSAALRWRCNQELRPHPELKDAFVVPDVAALTSDASWNETLDTLRPPRPRGVDVAEWRATSALRPVVFRDPGEVDAGVVHLHLEHRLVRRLLAQFRAQGFVQDDLARACLAVTSDGIARVLLLGRLSLLGEKASRLHEELVAVAARWAPPAGRKPLVAHGDETTEKSLALLREGLSKPKEPPAKVKVQLLEGAGRDVAELLPLLEAEAKARKAVALRELARRGEAESKELAQVIREQAKAIRAELDKLEDPKANQLELWAAAPAEERDQRERDARFWRERLARIPEELETEPARVKALYEVRTEKLDVVGLAYLWPEEG